MLARLTLNIWSFCLSLQSSRLTHMCHQIWHNICLCEYHLFLFDTSSVFFSFMSQWTCIFFFWSSSVPYPSVLWNIAVPRKNAGASLCFQSINGRRSRGWKGTFTIVSSISKKLHITLNGRTHTQEIPNWGRHKMSRQSVLQEQIVQDEGLGSFAKKLAFDLEFE